jgi:hypothetical protein
VWVEERHAGVAGDAEAALRAALTQHANEILASFVQGAI